MKRRQILFAGIGLFSGVAIAVGLLLYSHYLFPSTQIPFLPQKNEIIGFLPYWLLDRAQKDYSSSITSLTYFALRIDKDGSIQKLINPTQEEPGWHALQSGKVDPFLQSANSRHVALSLTIDSGDVGAIDSFVSNPNVSAHNLMMNVLPIMQKNHFTDLNLDIEYTANASSEARLHFIQFVKKVKYSLPQNTTLTLEISPIDAIQKRLIDIKGVSPYVNHVVIMAYDYHATDSTVTGPIAPLSGAGSISEYDVEAAVTQTLKQISPNKLILGIPLYGYEWETIGTIPRSAIIPDSGTIASNRRAEAFLTQCATCSAMFDNLAQETYISYFSSETNTNHILFFPDAHSTRAKVAFAENKQLGGLALWALGYEGNTILKPLIDYKK